jgi:hypothetical protein
LMGWRLMRLVIWLRQRREALRTWRRRLGVRPRDAARRIRSD